MTIKLQDNTTVSIPIGKKNDTGLYTLKLKYLQEKKIKSINLTDATPLNRFATFTFSGTFKEGSYSYKIMSGDDVVKEGLAYSGFISVSKNEYESEINIVNYD